MSTRGYYHISEPHRIRASSDPERTRLVPVSAVLALILFITVRVIYGVRVCQVLFVGDAGELATASYTSGIAHPPGYPLFTLLGRFFSHLRFSSPTDSFPPGIFDVAFRMNMMSLWLGVLTVVVVYFIVARILKNPFVAFLSAFLFATSTTFLSQSLVGEVYTLNGLITALIIYILLLINEKLTSWRLLLLALMFGLGIAHHTSVLAMAFPVLIFLFFTLASTRVKLTKNVLLGMLLFFIIGLLPYLYLPAASSHDPYQDWENPENIPNFFKLVTRSEYRQIKADIIHSDESLGFTGISKSYGGWLRKSFSRFFVYLGYFGLLIALFSGKRFGLLLGLLYLFMTVPYFIYFRNIPPQELFYLEVYYIPAHIVFSIFLGYIFYSALEKLPKIFKKPSTRFIFAILIFILLFTITMKSFNARVRNYSLRNHTIGSRYAYDVLSQLPENAILISNGDEIFLFWYMQQVAEYRKDIVILETDTLTKTGSWIWASTLRQHPDLIVPEFSKSTQMPENIFLEQLRISNSHRLIYMTGLSPELKPVTSDLKIISDGILYAYGKSSNFKNSPVLDSMLANGLFNAQLDFSIESADPYEFELLNNYVSAYYKYGNFFLGKGQNDPANKMLTRSFILSPDYQ
ncbi:DUF2723 domain-containing protein, partial [bacterium]|nr:DUF2723 domain-containing protein [bacterium]MBU1024706.1 DUF2723 domain-containing protein [bacterium]